MWMRPQLHQLHLQCNACLSVQRMLVSATHACQRNACLSVQRMLVSATHACQRNACLSVRNDGHVQSTELSHPAGACARAGWRNLAPYDGGVSGWRLLWDRWCPVPSWRYGMKLPRHGPVCLRLCACATHELTASLHWMSSMILSGALLMLRHEAAQAGAHRPVPLQQTVAFD